MTRHFLTLFDFSREELEQIFSLSQELKAKLRAGVREELFPRRMMGILFDKQSLRTRVSFETAMAHLGGSSMYLGQDTGWGGREPVADFGRVLSEYLDVLVCRTYAHSRIEELAAHCSIPVINGLTDWVHPCQAMADLFTLREVRGSLAGLKIAYVGDANNVARSLAVGCRKFGVKFAIASPKNYTFDDPFLQRLERDAPGEPLEITTDPREAVAAAAAVYTDVWTSMGQEAEERQRMKDFADYGVNPKLMAVAPSDAIFMHCLPAHRGDEVAAEVIDGPQSRVIQQAGNRMHVQKGVLAWLLGSG